MHTEEHDWIYVIAFMHKPYIHAFVIISHCVVFFCNRYVLDRPMVYYSRIPSQMQLMLTYTLSKYYFHYRI